MAEEKKFDLVTILGLMMAAIVFIGGQWFLAARHEQERKVAEQWAKDHPQVITPVPNPDDKNAVKGSDVKSDQHETTKTATQTDPLVPSAPSVPSVPSVPVEATSTEPKDEGDITVNAKGLTLVFTARGATLKQASLPEEFANPAKKDHKGLEILSEIEAGKRTFGLPSFEVGPGDIEHKSDRLMFEQATSLDKRVWLLDNNSKGFDKDGNWTVAYSTILGGKYTLTKTFIVPQDRPYFSVEMALANKSDQPVTFKYRLNGTAGILVDGPPNDPKGSSRFTGIQAQLAGRDAPNQSEVASTPDVTLVPAKGADAQPEEKRSVSRQENLWADLKNRFFIAMFISLEPDQLIKLEAVAMAPEPHEGDLRYSEPNLSLEGLRRESRAVEAGKESKPDRYALYLGPNTDANLERTGEQLKASEPLYLPEAFQYCDYFSMRWPRVDWLGAKFMWLFRGFNHVFGNYGMAVILLTLSIKLCLHPLTRKTTISMNKMQKLQPELNKIKKKYENQTGLEAKQRMGLEQQDLMKTAGVSQFGCLPMLIQIPVLTALYGIFIHAFEIRGASFLWIKDLSAPDHISSLPFYPNELNLLPVIYAGLQLIQMKLYPQQPPSDDPQQEMQRKMMSYMPLFISVMCYRLPSGLLLYFAASAAFGMLESWYIRKYLIKDGSGPGANPVKDIKDGGTGTQRATIVAKAR